MRRRSRWLRRARGPCDSVLTVVLAWVLALAACWPGSFGCHRRSIPIATKTATVLGRVVDSATDRGAKPLVGAVVELTIDPPDGRVPLATAKTSATGSFRMERVPIGNYRLSARSTAHLEAGTRIELTPAGARVELQLAPTVALAGYIEDTRGARVPLARVLAFAVAEAAAPDLHQTRADDRGRFRLSGLGPGAHRLLIEAPGLGTASAGPLTAPDESVVVIMPGESRAIVGQVIRAQRPVAGAKVLLGGEALAEPRSVETDGEGRFAFGGLGPGGYALRAEAGGFVGPVLAHVIVDRAQSQARHVELVLIPGHFVRGRVQGQDDHAVSGAAVQIDLVPATGLWMAVSTDARGDWTSPPLAPGTYRIRARHVGFVARRTVIVEVGRPQTASPTTVPQVTLELIRTGILTGRVVDGGGAPVAGATVRDRLAETEELGVIWSPLPLAAEAASLPGGAALTVASPDLPGGARRAITDAHGRFSLNEVPPGRLRVEVLNPSSIPLRTSPLTLIPGAKLDIGLLRVERAIQVTGRVLDADGSPLRGVRVGATRAVPPVAVSDTGPAPASGLGAGLGAGLYAVTDGSGAFSLPLAAGEHQLKASASGHTDVVTTINVAPAATPVTPITLRFTKNGDLTIEGRVHDSEGRPLARAQVSATATVDPNTPGTVRGASGSLATGFTDAGGHFRLTGLPGRSFQLEVHHGGYAVHRRTVVPGMTDDPVNIEVPVPGGIDGEVHEKTTGAPVPGFEIAATGPDGATARYPDTPRPRKRTAAEPLHFGLRRLAPGRWILRARAPQYHELERIIDVPSASVPGEPSVRDLRLEIERR